MTIANIYRSKSQELNLLLQNHPQPSIQLGEQLLMLIRTSWTNNYPPTHALRPFDLSPLVGINGFFTQNKERYRIFSEKILHLLRTQELNVFLEYFNADVALPTQAYLNNLGEGGMFAGGANGFYAATFFLMLLYPNEHFVHLRKPKNKIRMHPLVRARIDQKTIQELANNHLYNLSMYQELCNWIRNYQQRHQQNGNFIDFMDELEKILIGPNNVGNIGINTILYGPPGTGKTFNTINEAIKITNLDFFDAEESNREELKKQFDELVYAQQICFVTFHQSYSYEEFVEGIRARTDNKNNISYKVEDGIFKQICEDAKNDPDKNYVLIIDEINRGNISKIFGELITLIEDSKRTGNDEALFVTLPYSEKPFSVPNNLYIIGTMNTADRSLALMDTALRRRFEFVEMLPKPEFLNDIKIDGIDLRKMFETMNQRIEVLYDREHTLGHAFFMPLIDDPTIENLAGIFKNKIIPLLQEYFFEDWEKIRMVLKDYDDQKKFKFIVKDDIPINLFPNLVIDSRNYSVNSKTYKLNHSALYKNEAYIGIYQ